MIRLIMFLAQKLWKQCFIDSLFSDFHKRPIKFNHRKGQLELGRKRKVLFTLAQPG